MKKSDPNFKSAKEKNFSKSSLKPVGPVKKVTVLKQIKIPGPIVIQNDVKVEKEGLCYIQKQKNSYCGAHALNNLLQNCPRKNEFKNVYFVFDEPSIASTPSRINMNHVCEEIKKQVYTFLQLYKANGSIDEQKLKDPGIKDTLDSINCFPRSGDYSENVLREALKLVGLDMRQIYRKGDAKLPVARDIEAIIKAGDEGYGYIINNMIGSKKTVQHYICATNVNGNLVRIDSVADSQGRHVEPFHVDEHIVAMWVVRKR